MAAELIEIVADRLLGHSIDLMRYDAQLRREVLGQLLQLQDDLVEKLYKWDPTRTRTETNRIARLRQLLADVNKTIDTAYEVAAKIHAEGIFGVVQIEGQYAANVINAVVGADLLTARIDARTLKALAREAVVLGTPAEDYWVRQGENLSRRYADAVRLGLHQNEDMSGILQRVRGTFTGKYLMTEVDGRDKRMPQFVGGVLDMATKEATALIRTSVQSVANATRVALYEENEDVIKGVQALVTLDMRTTPLCRGRSGYAWKLPSGEPIGKTPIQFPGPPPWHFQCRSTLVPLIRSWAELAGPHGKISKRRLNALERDMPRRMQSSMDGQVAGDLTYETWLSKKTKEQQIEVLGPGRYKLWAEGKYGLTDFVDQTGRALRLDELRERL